jgi:hypothetical protein
LLLKGSRLGFQVQAWLPFTTHCSKYPFIVLSLADAGIPEKTVFAV